jgi:hypothetical protein
MILTKCYCDGEHPRLGHNCSFRPDVETLVAAVGAVLALCEESERAQHDYVAAVDVRRALLGLPPDDDPPWDVAPGSEQCIPCPHGGVHDGEYCRACEQNTGEGEGEAYCRVHS